MVNIYLYRKISTQALHPNPYIFDLEKALTRNFSIVNKKNNKIGILDVFRYFFKADVFYFNWIEILSQNKFGKFQTLVFYGFLILSKCFNKRIIWTLHNKYSHTKSKNSWTDALYSFMVKYSDLIFTHSQGGIDFVRSYYPKYVSKVKYIIHPVGQILPIELICEKKYDFLIWGNIQPYKGIIEFLKFVNGYEKMKLFKILIVGKCSDANYNVELSKYLSKNIIYYNDFFKLEEISKFASQTKFILFTYKLTSILSSGSLIDSIRMSSIILGPDDGAFKDLSCYSFVYTYYNFYELINIYENLKEVKSSYISSDIEDFYLENNWEQAGYKLNNEIVKIL